MLTTMPQCDDAVVIGAGAGRDEGRLLEELAVAIDRLERKTGRRLGDPAAPLLLAVRVVGEPVLAIPYIGLCDEVSGALDADPETELLAWDGYRRLVRAVGTVAAGVPAAEFDRPLRALKRVRGLIHDAELTDDDWREIVARYKAVFESMTGATFPQDPAAQLALAASALLKAHPAGSIVVDAISFGE